MNEKRLLIVSVSILMVLVGLSTAYYLIFYVPSRDRIRQEQIMEQERLGIKNEKVMQNRRKEEYESCLERAYEIYRAAWISKCKANGIENENGKETCAMRESMAKEVDEGHDKEKQACLEIYKSQ